MSVVEESIQRINVNHKGIEGSAFECRGGDVVDFLAKYHYNQAKKMSRIKDREERRKGRKRKEQVCVCLKKPGNHLCTEGN